MCCCAVLFTLLIPLLVGEPLEGRDWCPPKLNSLAQSRPLNRFYGMNPSAVLKVWSRDQQPLQHLGTHYTGQRGLSPGPLSLELWGRVRVSQTLQMILMDTQV